MIKKLKITLFILLNVVFMSACNQTKSYPFQPTQRDILKPTTVNNKAEIYTAMGIEGNNSFIIQNKSKHDALKRKLKKPLESYIADFQLTNNPNNRQEE